MIRFYTSLMLFFTFVTASFSQTDSLRVTLPAEVAPFLDDDAKDAVLYSDSTLTLHPSDKVELDLGYLQSAGSTYIIYIETLFLPRADSQLTIYDAAWHPCALALPAFKAEDFLAAPDSLDAYELSSLTQSLLPLRLRWRWDARLRLLSASISMEHLPAYERERLSRYFTSRRFSPEELLKK